MIYELLYIGFVYFSILIVSIIIHEIGHQQYIQYLLNNSSLTSCGVKNKITGYFNSFADFGLMAGSLCHYRQMSDRQYILVNFWGITAGLLFICFATIFIFDYAFLLTIPYLIGCKKDITEIFRTSRV